MQCILSINYCWPFGIQHGSGATPSLASNCSLTNTRHTQTHIRTKSAKKSTEKVITKLWFYGCINHFPLLYFAVLLQIAAFFSRYVLNCQKAELNVLEWLSIKSVLLRNTNTIWMEQNYSDIDTLKLNPTFFLCLQLFFATGALFTLIHVDLNVVWKITASWKAHRIDSLAYHGTSKRLSGMCLSSKARKNAHFDFTLSFCYCWCSVFAIDTYLKSHLKFECCKAFHH